LQVLQGDSGLFFPSALVQDALEADLGRGSDIDHEVRTGAPILGIDEIPHSAVDLPFPLRHQSALKAVQGKDIAVAENGTLEGHHPVIVARQDFRPGLDPRGERGPIWKVKAQRSWSL